MLETTVLGESQVVPAEGKDADVKDGGGKPESNHFLTWECKTLLLSVYYFTFFMCHEEQTMTLNIIMGISDCSLFFIVSLHRGPKKHPLES